MALIRGRAIRSLRTSRRSHLKPVESLENRVLLSTIYVDVNAPGVVQDGAGWETAYQDLQAALGAAAAGDEIRVADGTYKPTSGTNRAISFQLKSGVSVQGGYAGFGDENPDSRDFLLHATLLSGEIGTGSTSDNSQHVLNASGVDAAAVLQGFTVTGGREDSGNVLNGAGIYNVGGNPQILDCIITGNQVTEGVGGIYISGSASMLLARCTITSNVSGFGAAGIVAVSSNVTLIDCTISANVAGPSSTGGFGMGSSTVSFSNCTISGNVGPNGGVSIYESNATFTDCVIRDHTSTGISKSSVSFLTMTNCVIRGNGTGVSNGSGGSAVLTDCRFIENTGAGMGSSGPAELTRCTFTRNLGGGIGITASSPTLVNCVFEGNTATRGGGVRNTSSATPTLIQCIFSGNSASDRGGGMYNESGSSPILINTEFSGNVAAVAGGSISNASASATLTNCISWGNSAPASAELHQTSSGTFSVTYSDIQGGFAGTGNINVDPQFIRNPSRGPDNAWGTADDDYGVLRVKMTSPCIDAGNNAAVPAPITTDFEGKARFTDVPTVRDPGVIVDIGAYEYIVPLLATGGAYLFDVVSPGVNVVFNGDLLTSTLSIADIRLYNPVTGQLIGSLPGSASFYDAGTRTASRLFASALPDGNYQMRINLGAVSDTKGNSLSANYQYDFFVLAGDANRDRVVDVRDMLIVASNWLGTGKVFSQGDFNYDGVVNVFDLTILAQKWQYQLDAPSPSPPLPAPATPTIATRRAPIRTAVRAIGLVP